MRLLLQALPTSPPNSHNSCPHPHQTHTPKPHKHMPHLQHCQHCLQADEVQGAQALAAAAAAREGCLADQGHQVLKQVAAGVDTQTGPHRCTHTLQPYSMQSCGLSLDDALLAGHGSGTSARRCRLGYHGSLHAPNATSQGCHPMMCTIFAHRSHRLDAVPLLYPMRPTCLAATKHVAACFDTHLRSTLQSHER